MRRQVIGCDTDDAAALRVQTHASRRAAVCLPGASPLSPFRRVCGTASQVCRPARWELAKARLYGADEVERRAAEWTLYQALRSVLKLLAPYLPYVTDALFQRLHRALAGAPSLH